MAERNSGVADSGSDEALAEMVEQLLENARQEQKEIKELQEGLDDVYDMEINRFHEMDVQMQLEADRQEDISDLLRSIQREGDK